MATDNNNEQRVLAWHFLREDGRLGLTHRASGHVRVTAGRTLRWDGEVRLCESGLHASVSALDALNHAPGCVVSRVEVWGNVVRGPDKIAGSRRRALWVADASVPLRLFAADCAERALGRVGNPDPRSLAAVAAARAFARGEISREGLDVAECAARLAARAAVADAARYVAESAAKYAAESAANDAVRYASGAAADSAAWAVVRYARFAVADAADSAAWAAADSASRCVARNAERKWQAEALTARLEALEAEQ